MNGTTSIYGLIDPRTGCLRYIGQTGAALYKRAWRHRNPRAGDLSKKAIWIRELVAVDLRPLLEIIEVVQHEDGHDAERFHIASVRAAGAALLNMADGGYAATRLGRRNSQEHNAKISVAHVGMKAPPAASAAMSRARIGMKASRASIEKRADKLRGKSQAADHVEARAAANRGKKRSAESIERMRAAALARRRDKPD